MSSTNECYFCKISLLEGSSACDRHLKELQKEYDTIKREYSDFLNFSKETIVLDEGVRFGHVERPKELCCLCLNEVLSKGYCKYHYYLQYEGKPLYNSEGDVILPEDRHKSENLSVAQVKLPQNKI